MRVGEKAEGWMAKSSTSLVVKIDLNREKRYGLTRRSLCRQLSSQGFCTQGGIIINMKKKGTYDWTSQETVRKFLCYALKKR